MKDFFEHIDDYMAGQLTGSEYEAFAAELKQNESLRNAVSNYDSAKRLSEGLLEIDMLETIQKLEEGDQATPQKEIDKKENKNTGRNWFILISMVMLLSFLALWLSNGSTSDLDKEEILASYIKPVDGDATRSIDTVGMNHFQKGKYYFALNRFNESEKWLTRYIEKEKDQQLLSQAYFWLGSAHLEQWEVKEAKRVWSKSEEIKAKNNLRILE